MYVNGYKLWMTMVINYGWQWLYTRYVNGYKLWMAMVINYGCQWL